MNEASRAVDVSLRRGEGRLSRCPFCHEDLDPESHPACSLCRAPMHTECAREGGACASCGSEVGVALPPPALSPGPSRSRELIEPLLLPSETLIWAGSPGARARFTPHGAAWVLLGLGLCAGVGLASTSGLLRLVSILGAGVLAFAACLANRAHYHYGLTDQRVLRVPHRGGSPSSVYLSSLAEPALRPGRAGRGTITLGLPGDAFDWNPDQGLGLVRLLVGGGPGASALPRVGGAARR